jgi:hypothetical protein
MKLALHRSITFWSGLLVLVFVVWAWRDSLTRMSFISRDRLQLYSGYGAVFAASIDTRIRTTEFRRGEKLPRPELSATFQSPSFVRGHGPPFDATAIGPDRVTGRGSTMREIARDFSEVQSPKSWKLCVPFWVIWLTVAFFWLCALFWRARRRAVRGATCTAGEP